MFSVFLNQNFAAKADFLIRLIHPIRPILAVLLLALAFPPSPARAEDTNTATLEQCFAETIAHNPELQRLRQDVERAAGTKLEIRARELPYFAAQANTGLRGGSLYGKDGPYAIFTAQFAQPVFNTGMAASWRRGLLEIVATQQALNLAACDRLRELRTYYLRAQRLGGLIALYEEMIRRLQANVTGEQQRRDAGLAGPRPVLQAKVQLLAAQGELTAFRREESEVRLDMGEIMLRPADQLPRPAGRLEREPVHPDWPALAHTALERRADLKFLRTLGRMAAEDRRVIQSGYFPFVSLVGSGLYLPGRTRVSQATPIILGQTPLTSDGRFGGSLTWQIIDNGQVTGPSRRLEAIRQEYEVSLRALEDNIPRELARISHALENASARLDALDKSAAEADEDLRLVETRIAIGDATQLDFSDGQRNVLAVRHAVLDALFDYNSALAELDWVTGRYLEFAGPAPEP